MSNTAWKAIDLTCPRIILTAGEPAGIGPDLIVKIAQYRFAAALTVIADPLLLAERARLLNLPLTLQEQSPGDADFRHKPGALQLLPVTTPSPVTPGRLNVNNATYVLETISLATQACLRGDFDAVVTAPVTKAIINEAGIPFRGHTEFIADLCSAKPVMMLMNERLRVALVTTHLPLSEVAAAIIPLHLEEVIQIVHKALQGRMGINSPSIMVCGLNPHAGEGGYLGREEIEVIIPVLEKLRAAGYILRGPTPADTAFTPASLQGIDAVVTMYHDQGLSVLKAQGFGETVNLTLGLPIIRTSVDHGSALELAGSGRARADSLQAAIKCAIDLAKIGSVSHQA